MHTKTHPEATQGVFCLRYTRVNTIYSMQKQILFFIVFSLCALAPRLHVLAFAPEPNEVIKFINAVRVSHNLPVFTESVALDKAAEVKAQGIANLGVLVHTEAPAGTEWQNTMDAGYVFQKIGENLATNISDPETLVNAWMNSPAHRVNILNPTFTDIGVATVPGVFGGTAGSYTVEYTASPRKVSDIGTSATYSTQGTSTSIITNTQSVSTTTKKQNAALIIKAVIALLQQLLIMKST